MRDAGCVKMPTDNRQQTTDNKQFCILICKHFEREVKAVLSSGAFDDVSMAAFPAGCGSPRMEWDDLCRAAGDCAKSGQVYVFGSCCIAGLGKPPPDLKHWDVHRLNQCFYLLDHRERIDEYLRKGCYLISPGWLINWQYHIEIWGFDQNTVREFFAESAKELILLDTGIDANSAEHLKAFAEFVDRPFRIMRTGLDLLKLFLEKNVLKWRLENQRKKAEAALKQSQKQATDHAMTMDWVSTLARTFSEKEAVENILSLFTMLFAPGTIFYLPFKDGNPAASADDRKNLRERLSALSGEYAWTESGAGFRLRISHRNETLGILEVDKIAFPEYKEKYLNVALSLVSVCGLAIDHARRYQQIIKQKDQLAQTLEELRETQRHLVEAEKMASLGNLVAGVAHEINTPVGVGITASSDLVDRTKNFADFFKKGQMKRSDLQNYLNYVYKAGGLILTNLQRTGGLIQSFKQVSVDQTSEQQRQFYLKAYLQDILRSLEPKLREKPVQIKIQCDENLELNSYPGVFAHILTNLVMNSLVHGFRDKSAGNIHIAGEIQGSHLSLRYEDDGMGIAAEILPKIFDPFFTTDKQTGTGLGMHIVYNLVTQKLKGSVSCESEKGQGVLFIICMPLSQK
jgi:signal transduction histidine kinase